MFNWNPELMRLRDERDKLDTALTKRHLRQEIARLQRELDQETEASLIQAALKKLGWKKP